MVQTIPPTTLRDRLDTAPDSITVVDVRRPEEFALGHIETAINIPLSQLATEVDRYEWSEEIVIVCPIGPAAKQAAKLLMSYEKVDSSDVYCLEGGYSEWPFELISSSEPE